MKRKIPKYFSPVFLHSFCVQNLTLKNYNYEQWLYYAYSSSTTHYILSYIFYLAHFSEIQSSFDYRTFYEILVVYILQQWGLIVEENLQFKYSDDTCLFVKKVL